MQNKKIKEDDSIQRLINLVHVIRLLGQENGTTNTEITEKTGISRWTVSRMLDRLSIAGLQIYEPTINNPQADKREKRYKIDKDSLWTMTLPNTVMSPEERELFSFLLGIASNVPVLGKNAHALQEKIKWIDSKPSTKIINIPKLSKKINLNTPEVVKVILKAIEESKWLSFEYYSINYDENKDYKVKPAYLFVYDNNLYLRCIKPDKGYYVNFAIERFVGIPKIIKAEKKIEVDPNDITNLTNDPFGPLGSGKIFEAEIHLGSWQGYYADLLNWPDTCVIEEQEDGSYILKARTSNRFGLVQWIVQQGNDATVISPKELREEVIGWLKSSLVNYGEV